MKPFRSPQAPCDGPLYSEAELREHDRLANLAWVAYLVLWLLLIGLCFAGCGPVEVNHKHDVQINIKKDPSAQGPIVQGPIFGRTRNYYQDPQQSERRRWREGR